MNATIETRTEHRKKGTGLSCFPRCFFYASIAQMVERRFCNATVEGSIPSAGLFINSGGAA